MLPFEFNFKEPDYNQVFEWRVSRLAEIRKHPESLPHLKTYYRGNIADFINDWGCTFDPRNVSKGLPAVIPFILMPRQEEFIQWFMEKWNGNEPGLVDKSRDMGLSWLTMGMACSICLFNPGVVAGFGSRKEEYVDKIGSPKSLFYKARMFMEYLPDEFRGSWDKDKHAPHMRINFPDTQSFITGESGDGIGRGDRTSFYIVDESAFLQRPQLTENSLSQTTNCRIDVSTHNGPATIFNQKKMKGVIDCFEFDWRDDPRKDQAWYDKQVEELDPVTVAQEIDRNPNASVEGVLIPSVWVESAIDSHKKLGFEITGENVAALDVADEGRDFCAYSSGRGILVDRLVEWSGKGDDIFGTTERAIRECDTDGVTKMDFDSDGLGVGVRGDARVINDRRVKEGLVKIDVKPWRGSGEVINPEKLVPTIGANDDERGKNSRLNKDFFANAKAQACWGLRLRFQQTHKAVTGQIDNFDKDSLISISSDLDLLTKLKSELCQPTYSFNTAGKMVIDKAPKGSKSPNLFDSVMIKSAPKKQKAAGFFDL